MCSVATLNTKTMRRTFVLISYSLKKGGNFPLLRFRVNLDKFCGNTNRSRRLMRSGTRVPRLNRAPVYHCLIHTPTKVSKISTGFYFFKQEFLACSFSGRAYFRSGLTFGNLSGNKFFVIYLSKVIFFNFNS